MLLERSTDAERTKIMAMLRSMSSSLVSLAIAAVLISPDQAAAQEKFPSRPIEMIVPTPPGGGVDITGRMMAEVLEPILGVKVLVINVPGASGAVGVTRMTTAKPDGYTIAYIWNAPLTIAPHVLQVGYTLDGYTPLSQSTGGTPMIFCVRPDFPATTGKEFVELIVKNPNKYTYGNDGIGAIVQLAGERLFQTLGMKMRGVPFGGAGETLRAFLGAQVDIFGGSIPPISPYMKDGKARCLIVTTAERNSNAPDALSATDLGHADAATELWRGAIVPKGVPADRLKVLEDAFRKAAGAAVFNDYVAKTGERMVGSNSEAFGKLIASEYADFGKVVQGLGISKK